MFKSEATLYCDRAPGHPLSAVPAGRWLRVPRAYVATALQRYPADRASSRCASISSAVDHCAWTPDHQRLCFAAYGP